jgi:hypothetical protein
MEAMQGRIGNGNSVGRDVVAAFAARILLVALLLPFAARAEPVEVSLRLASGTEIVSQRYPASGDVLAVWLTDQGGPGEEEQKAAADMAAKGVETWLTDCLAPYFLPLLPSSWNQVPDQDMAEWLDTLQRQNRGKRIVLIATGRAAGLALRAANAWQARYGGGTAPPLAGALLMWPLLYQELAPGQEPEYDPAVRQSHMDLVILQPMSSAGYWWRERLKEFLEGAGSRVWLDVLPGLRDSFYRRSDINPQEISAGARLGEILLNGLKPLIDKERP